MNTPKDRKEFINAIPYVILVIFLYFTLLKALGFELEFKNNTKERINELYDMVEEREDEIEKLNEDILDLQREIYYLDKDLYDLIDYINGQ